MREDSYYEQKRISRRMRKTTIYRTVLSMNKQMNLFYKNKTKKITEIMNLKANHYISQKEYKFLSNHLHSSRTPLFYGLPKIHKFFEKFPPLRPIVSGFNSISASLSEYVWLLKIPSKNPQIIYEGHRLFNETQITINYTINFHLSHYGRQQHLH